MGGKRSDKPDESHGLDEAPGGDPDPVRQRASDRLRDLWLPVCVGMVGALMSLAVWGVLVAERHAALLESTAATSAEVAHSIEDRLAQEIHELEGLAALWERFGLGSPAEWQADADHRVERTDGPAQLAWVGGDGGDHRVAARAPAAAAAIDPARALRHRDRPHLAGPERDATGAVVFHVFLPVRAGDGHGGEPHEGVLAARFPVEPWLEAALQGRAQGYALTVLWDEEEIFRRGDPSPDPWQAWWRHEEAVALPLGGQWRTVYRPSPALAAVRLTPVPHYLLATGLLLSIFVAVVAYQLRVIRRQARFLRASNQALERRGHELESKVAERTAELRDAIERLEAFNYSVSHDLRSPLGAIQNFASILEEDHRDRPLDEEGQRLLGRIRGCAARATDLLEDLLALSRTERVELSFERIDMTALARETFAQVRVAEGDEEDVEVRIDPLPETLGDRALLADVFANLFSNALKYSRGCAKRTIHVSGRHDEDESVAVYEVADNGQGFDMRFSEKLFGVFERLHADDRIEGTGIGLAMVARIVKRHGGRVWATGQPGEGARFSFTLPHRSDP